MFGRYFFAQVERSYASKKKPKRTTVAHKCVQQILYQIKDDLMHTLQ